MPLYDLAICVRDEEDLPSGHKRKKEGDVIACRLHSETVRLGGWGRKELPSHIMVTVDMTEEEAALLQHPQYEDGSYGEGEFVMMDITGPGNPWEADTSYYNTELDMGGGTTQLKIDSITESNKIFTKNNQGTGVSGSVKPDFASATINDIVIDNEVEWKCVNRVNLREYSTETYYEVGDYIIDEDDWIFKCIVAGTSSNSSKTLTQTYKNKIKDGGVEFECIGKKNPQRVGKRRYNIPLDILKDGWCPEMNLDDVRNKSKVYQPFIDGNITIDSSEQVSLIKDKHKGTFKYSTKKIKE